MGIDAYHDCQIPVAPYQVTNFDFEITYFHLSPCLDKPSWTWLSSYSCVLLRQIDEHP
jgi:hypothetical protein